ncbi:histone-lysine N-methyltransferase SETMAR-like [Vanessa tameamea]|uniref:Histone-lysine N-methyltransferase SETMAR-like n=1 Tax=Vanessa tameamea TaxID=334116 RepID=A0ABM4AP61_VANTA
MENMKYRYIYEYEFYRGTSAAETARRINVYGAGVAKESTLRFWFQRFRFENFDLQNQPCGRPETKVENEELKAIVEADSLQSTSETAVAFGVNDKTVLIHMKQIGKVRRATIGMSAPCNVRPGPCSNRLPFFPEFGPLLTRKKNQYRCGSPNHLQRVY